MVIGKPANYLLSVLFQPRHTSVYASPNNCNRGGDDDGGGVG